MIEKYTKQNILRKDIDYIVNKVSTSGQLRHTSNIIKRLKDIYLIKKDNKIIGFTCNKTSILEGFDIELGYAWIDPNLRGNIYGIKLFDYQVKDIKNNKLKAYSVNRITNTVMTKYCKKKNFKRFFKTNRLEWWIINK
tara:strand:- start:515 stop:928 length:414 start_codon:yes stop_codon:yes gene_type:complete